MSQRTACVILVLMTAGALACVFGAVIPHILPAWAAVRPIIWYLAGMLEGAALSTYLLCSQTRRPGGHTDAHESEHVMPETWKQPDVDWPIGHSAYVHYVGKSAVFMPRNEFNLIPPAGASDCLWMLPGASLTEGVRAVRPQQASGSALT